MVGVRDRNQAEEAFRRLETASAGPDRQTQYTRGAMAGLLWALGRGDPSPVTAWTTEGEPTMETLTAEADAATVQMEDATQRNIPRDYLRGVSDALAWVCGHTDNRPSHPVH
ncbi:hypothetical protein QNO07_13675 [Streptomyces sp. 549]|uniref:hypothetical protein n=1 Tax=Streptomyces sp. 549 TaxID=3049076 RepID=UPI0024C27733|nr:hypothetical protein [Streptomyces sp. 549]MDK1474456.1 hypothetical protein [Streptomyces sp. 549]